MSSAKNIILTAAFTLGLKMCDLQMYILKKGNGRLAQFWLDCKTVVSAVSVILACEAREPHTACEARKRLSPFSLAVFTLAPDRSRPFVRIFTVAHVRKKIRLFGSLNFGKT